MPSVSASCHLTSGLSAHARQRVSRRAIPFSLLELLLDHSARVPAGGGAEIVHFTPAIRRASAVEADNNCAARLPSARAVTGLDGMVTTVGCRFRRMGRD